MLTHLSLWARFLIMSSSIYDEPLLIPPHITSSRSLRSRVYVFVTQSKAFIYTISALIVMNISFAAFIADDDKNGVPDLGNKEQLAYFCFEASSTVFFTFEFTLRMWSCVEDPTGVLSRWRCLNRASCGMPSEPAASMAYAESGGHPAVVNTFLGRLGARVRWISNLMNILDLVVVITFWGDLVLEVYATEKVKGIASSLRILRLFQIALTVFKLESVSPGFRRVARVFSSRSSELLVCVFLALALTMLGAILVYFVEGSLSSGNVINLETFPECKQMPHRFASLTRCIYWCAMTVTTVGYGDMHPCTSLGQLLASVWGFFGVAVVALPSGIIGSGLVDVMVRTVVALERASPDHHYHQW